MAEEIKQGTKVRLHYTGKLQSGETFDTSIGREPLEFTVGQNMIIPGLEKQIVGMKQGEKRTVTVPPEDAYGSRRDDLVREVPKGPGQGQGLQPGSVVYLRTQDGQNIPALIKEVKDNSVVIDLNHPLAGKQLVFEVEVVSIA